MSSISKLTISSLANMRPLGFHVFLRLKISRLGHHFSGPMLESVSSSQLPRKIWIFWNSGRPGAPEIVQYCISS